MARKRRRFTAAFKAKGRVSTSTQTQALCALLFLFKHDLRMHCRRSMRCGANDPNGCTSCCLARKSATYLELCKGTQCVPHDGVAHVLHVTFSTGASSLIQVMNAATRRR